MNILKKTILGAALAAASSGAFANNIGNVIWDPSAGSDFVADANMFESFASNVGQNVIGYGEIGKLNGVVNFCSGCELTYSFQYTMTYAQTLLSKTVSGSNTTLNYETKTWDPLTSSVITQTASAVIPNLVASAFSAGSSTFEFTAGDIKFFVDNTPDFDINNTANLTKANATDGVMFLHAIQNGSLSGTATNLFSLTSVKGNGEGYLDVIDGIAKDAFNTNFFTLHGGADLSFNSEFSYNTGVKEINYPLTGTVSFRGNSKEIPEPASLALLGMGLLGFGASRMRKQA